MTKKNQLQIETPDRLKIFITNSVTNNLCHQFYPVLAKVQINRGLLYIVIKLPCHESTKVKKY